MWWFNHLFLAKHVQDHHWYWFVADISLFCWHVTFDILWGKKLCSKELFRIVRASGNASGCSIQIFTTYLMAYTLAGKAEKKKKRSLCSMFSFAECIFVVAPNIKMPHRIVRSLFFFGCCGVRTCLAALVQRPHRLFFFLSGWMMKVRVQSQHLLFPVSSICKWLPCYQCKLLCVDVERLLVLSTVSRLNLFFLFDSCN